MLTIRICYPYPQYFTELYTLLNRAKELKSSDVTHVTQQDVVVRENKWRCLKYFYANGYNMYVGSLQIVNENVYAI